MGMIDNDRQVSFVYKLPRLGLMYFCCSSFSYVLIFYSDEEDAIDGGSSQMQFISRTLRGMLHY